MAHKRLLREDAVFAVAGHLADHKQRSWLERQGGARSPPLPTRFSILRPSATVVA
jgi:hypothetical protein